MLQKDEQFLLHYWLVGIYMIIEDMQVIFVCDDDQIFTKIITICTWPCIVPEIVDLF